MGECLIVRRNVGNNDDTFPVGCTPSGSTPSLTGYMVGSWSQYHAGGEEIAMYAVNANDSVTMQCPVYYRENSWHSYLTSAHEPIWVCLGFYNVRNYANAWTNMSVLLTLDNPKITTEWISGISVTVELKLISGIDTDQWCIYWTCKNTTSSVHLIHGYPSEIICCYREV